jgi:hypothetical protein
MLHPLPDLTCVQFVVGNLAARCAYVFREFIDIQPVERQT